MSDEANQKLKEAIQATVAKGAAGPTPEGVFEAAKVSSSPLHPYFEWNKDAGWRKHNLELARGLISKVYYKVWVPDEQKPVIAPYYVKDSATPNQQGYEPVNALAAQGAKKYQTLLTELRSCRSWAIRVSALAKATKVEVDFDSIVLALDAREQMLLALSKQDDQEAA
jgi:hypothetical protein